MKTEIYHIIADQLRGKISVRDLEILNSWLENSAENRKVYDEVVSLWRNSGNAESIDANINHEWERFTVLMTSAGPKKNQIHLKDGWKPLYRVAAVLIPLIVLSLTGIILHNQSRSNQWIHITTGIERKHFVLPDSTEIWLNHHSEISYPNNIAQNRLVKINGEAYFKVAKTGARFRVDAGTSIVQVMGTRFNVENNYDSITRVIVDEGRVLFYAKSEKKSKLSLTAGEKGILVHKQNKLIKETEPSQNASAWFSNHLMFDNTPLHQVKTDLEKYFSIRLGMSDSVENCLFSGEFYDPQLKNILEVIALATGGRISQTDHIIYISGHSCNN